MQSVPTRTRFRFNTAHRCALWLLLLSGACSQTETGADEEGVAATDPTNVMNEPSEVEASGRESDAVLAPANEESTVAAVGGQSGGETGNSRPAAQAPVSCACLESFLQDESTPVAVRVKILRLEGGCAELEVVEELAEIWDVEPGDVIGGSVVELCQSDEEPTYAAGDEVLAIYQKAYESYWDCPAYLECTESRCGDQPDDEANIEDWDRCDGDCVVETREACDRSTPEQEQVGGTVRLAQLDADLVSYYWAGQWRTSTLEELAEPGCYEEHNALFAEHIVAATHGESPTSDGASPEDAASAGDAEPSGAAEGSLAPAPMPDPASGPMCPLPGWEVHFPSSAESPADAGAPDTDGGER